MSSERRRYIRLGTDQNVNCHISGVDFIHVVGLGADGTGMRVITNKELPAGEFPIQLEPEDGDGVLQASAKVVWHESKDFEFTQRHFSGLALFNLDDSAKSRLNKMLDQAVAAGGAEDHH